MIEAETPIGALLTALVVFVNVAQIPMLFPTALAKYELGLTRELEELP